VWANDTIRCDSSSFDAATAQNAAETRVGGGTVTPMERADGGPGSGLADPAVRRHGSRCAPGPLCCPPIPEVPLPFSPAFIQRLGEATAPDRVSVEPAELEAYGRDWTRVVPPKPSAVVFPTSTAEVARVVKLCASHRVPIVPSGGRTGLSGGAVAARGELVLSLERMRRMGPVDLLARTVRVEAGAVTQAVHEHCAPYGLTWPVDFASKGSSQVGGNIATNAGGVKVIRYGLTRQWVLGLQVVTGTGEVLELNGALEKNQTGLDLRQLFIGSEGTLGIVTEATLKLAPLPNASDVFFFALESFPAVLSLFAEVRASGFVVNAFEMLGHNCLEAVLRHRRLRAPFEAGSPYYVLLEVERPSSDDAIRRLEDWLERLFSEGKVVDGALAQSSAEARSLWALREGISESLSALYTVWKHDIALPIAKLGGFVDDFLRMLATTYQGFELFLFGHIGDGNLHVNIRKPEALAKVEFLERCRAIDGSLFALVRAYQGSVSAEHGIGLLKKHALAFSRSPAEIAMMRAVKKALDPEGILNPGKIFD
jgi:glycolate oxidase subunit GlcD